MEFHPWSHQFDLEKKCAVDSQVLLAVILEVLGKERDKAVGKEDMRQSISASFLGNLFSRDLSWNKYFTWVTKFLPVFLSRELKLLFVYDVVKRLLVFETKSSLSVHDCCLSSSVSLQESCCSQTRVATVIFSCRTFFSCHQKVFKVTTRLGHNPRAFQ